jgi:MoxR-like ATPase
VKVWGEGDNDIWLRLAEPVFEGVAPRQSTEIDVHGDDFGALFTAQQRLNAAGFAKVSVRPLVRDADEAVAFSFRPGRFSGDDEAAKQIEEIVTGMMAERDVDVGRYPLLRTREPGSARIVLPFGVHRAGALRPYVGDSVERWDVRVRTDAPADAAPLVEQLRAAGYSVEVEPLPAKCLGFRLGIGGLNEFPERVDTLRARTAELIDGLALAGRTTIQVDAGLSRSSPRVEIDLPIRMIREGRFEDAVRGFAPSWDFSLKAPSGAHPDLSVLFAEMGFKSFGREETAVSLAEIKFGGAPRALVEHLADLIHDRTGMRCALVKAWGDGDDDIWVYLPAVAEAQVAEAGSADAQVEDVDLSAWFGSAADAAPRPLLEIGADSVRIGHLVLPRRRGLEDVDRRLVPPPSLFDHYCLDQRTAETLLHVADGVVLREPVLLEGETSVSKTSIIQLLAMFLDQPLVRLNLNGQTDTGELVGRFLPQSTAADLPLDPAEMLASADLLETESRTILERVRDQGRKLNAVEIQQIMANERMAAHPWKWVDGLVISAMKRGWWVVLDELNLAEPQILERLNSVLERHPSIVLTEHDNTVFGAGGVPVHPEFRIFATMNPAEYAGRSPLSPAYRDRWRGYRFIDPPSEQDYHAMLAFLVSGAQPDVVVRGRRYTGGFQAPAYAALQGIDGLDQFMLALARFHSALESATRNPEQGHNAHLGVRRQEKYVFTRRGLLAVMDYLVAATAAAVDPVEAMRVGLARYYLGRVATAADRATVARLLDAAGIGLKTWTLAPA